MYRYGVVGDGICSIMEEDEYRPESDRTFWASEDGTGRSRRMGRR